MANDNLPVGVKVGIHYWDGQNQQYVFYNNGSGSASQYIPPMQGFFIQSTVDNLTFTIPASARSTSGIDVFNKKSGNGKPFITNETAPRIPRNRLIISSATNAGKTDKAFIEFHEKASTGFDHEFDAVKFASNNDSIADIFLRFENSNYSIYVLPLENLEGRYDLNVDFGLNESFILSFDDIATFEPTQPILLHDKLTGTYYDLRENNTLQFINQQGQTKRFELVFDNYLATSDLDNFNGWFTRTREI